MADRRPRARTWTLAALDRGQVYRLWFDAPGNRWVLAALDAPDVPIVTRTAGARTDRVAGAPAPSTDRRTSPAAG